MSSRDEEFARVVVTHRNSLLRYGLRRVDDPSAAEDLVAETFVVVWRRFDELPPRAEELFWLYGIAGRVLSNLLRGHQRSMRLEARLAFEREGEFTNPRFTGEDIEALLAALGELSPQDRELIQFTYWEKLSYREMGIVLGCSEKAAGIRLSRARQHLRERLNQSSTETMVSPLRRGGTDS
ncbi:MAG: RNA polymerase sigma factor [Acidimicrobiales bacterium]